MLVLAFAIALGAPDAGLAALAAADARLAAVAWRLQIRNRDLCSDVRALPGFTVHALSQYPPADRALVARHFGLGGYPVVLAVAPGSAAERVGLMPGDAIVAIDDVQVTADGWGRARYDAVAAVEDAIETALARPPATLTVQRSGKSAEIALSGDAGCASRVQLVPGGSLNAGADGRYVEITGKMFDFVATDDELAAVTAHELAHNILRHRERRTPSRQAETEADRLSVWLVARAGYDVDAVTAVWSRLRVRTDLGIFSDFSHPRWKGRLARLAAAVVTVKAQRAAGEALVPPAEAAQQSSSQPANPR